MTRRRRVRWRSPQGVAVVTLMLLVVVLAGLGGVVLASAASRLTGPPAYKVRAWEKSQRLQAHEQVGVSPAPKPLYVPLPSPSSCPTPTPATTPGVYSALVGAPPNDSYRVSDEAYAGVIDGYGYQIWSGALSTDVGQGYLLVLKDPMDPCAESDGWLKTVYLPAGEGEVTIVSLNGDAVSYTTTAGMEGTFNFVTMTLSP